MPKRWHSCPPPSIAVLRRISSRAKASTSRVTPIGFQGNPTCPLKSIIDGWRRKVRAARSPCYMGEIPEIVGVTVALDNFARPNQPKQAKLADFIQKNKLTP